ncbi:MAG: hypothetical protein GY869_09880 [Planctomycetes bacterium]|nr:hypothetical protein [Planctomycetota bacterium]
MKRNTVLKLSLLMVCGLSSLCWAQGFGTMITYQGKLSDNGSPANGRYDFEFELFDAASLGVSKGSTIPVNDYNVYDGHFTVPLDFGPLAFDGNARWLEIRVRPYDSIGTYTTLKPRQEITPNAYAIRAKLAENVVGGVGIGGNGTANYIPKFLDPTSLGNSVLFESSDYIGIGDATPTNFLDINSDAFNMGISLDGKKAIGGWAGNIYLRLNPDSDFDKVYVPTVLEAGYFTTWGGIHIGGNTDPGDDNLIVVGQVGIGTTPSTRKLEVRGDSSNYMGYFFNAATGTNSPYGLCGAADARGTTDESSHAGVFYSWAGTTSGGAFGVSSYAYANGNSPAYGIYSNARDGSTTGPEWAFYGLGDGFFEGDVGIGTAFPSAKLDVVGTIQMKDGNEADGKLMVSDADGNAAWKNGREYTVSGPLNLSAKNASSIWTKMNDIFTFTKDNAATDIEVVMNSNVRAGIFAGGASGIRFQIRIDDNSTVLSNDGAIGESNREEFLSIFAVFQGLSAGNHTVSVWIHTDTGTSTGVSLDPGGWGGRIIVKEIW